MKTIVCFGDSNTWGYMPGSDGGRFPRDVRWPARLATALADEAEVIAEGLNGRIATIESPVAEGRNGLPYLVPCLRSHAPVDLLDLDGVASYSDLDDSHLEEAGHIAVAAAVEGCIHKMLL